MSLKLILNLITQKYENIIYLGEIKYQNCQLECQKLGGHLPMVIYTIDYIELCFM